jgi:hypothetical protein
VKAPRALSCYVCVTLACLGLHLSGAEHWMTFRSEEAGFTVLYPASWYRSGSGTRGLDIFNFPPSKSVHGVVLPRSGAQLAVGRATSRTRTLNQWINQDLRGERPISRRKIARPAEGAGACTELLEVAWLSAVGPAAYFSYTSYYCSTGDGRLYQILLTNWKGNPKQQELRNLALRVALSLKQFSKP